VLTGFKVGSGGVSGTSIIMLTEEDNVLRFSVNVVIYFFFEKKNKKEKKNKRKRKKKNS
jgi:hypothetical protein